MKKTFQPKMDKSAARWFLGQCDGLIHAQSKVKNEVLTIGEFVRDDDAKLAVAAVNQFAALQAVAEAAKEFVAVCGSLQFLKYSGSHYEEWKAAKDALAKLSALRGK